MDARTAAKADQHGYSSEHGFYRECFPRDKIVVLQYIKFLDIAERDALLTALWFPFGFHAAREAH
jgi:hypothetical protein